MELADENWYYLGRLEELCLNDTDQPPPGGFFVREGRTRTTTTSMQQRIADGAAAASVAAGSGTIAMHQFSVQDWAAVAGACAAIGAMLVSWFYHHKADRRARRKLAEALDEIKSD